MLRNPAYDKFIYDKTTCVNSCNDKSQKFNKIENKGTTDVKTANYL